MVVRSMLLLTFFFSLASQSVLAQTTPLPLLWCNACTPAQKNAAALTQTVGSTVYVGDTSANTVNAYRVYLDIDDSTRPATRTKVADAITPVAPYKDDALALIAWYRTSPAGWTKQREVQYDGPGGAGRIGYDVVNDSPARNDLLDWATSGMLLDIGSQVNATAGKIRSFITSQTPGLQVVIVFSDRSRITLELDFQSSDGQHQVWKVVPNSGRDSNNNTIRSTHTNEPVEARFQNMRDGFPTNPVDFSRWTTQMTRIGYTVNTGGRPSGGTWACVTANGVSHCEYVQY